MNYSISFQPSPPTNGFKEVCHFFAFNVRDASSYEKFFVTSVLIAFATYIYSSLLRQKKGTLKMHLLWISTLLVASSAVAKSVPGQTHATEVYTVLLHPFIYSCNARNETFSELMQFFFFFLYQKKKNGRIVELWSSIYWKTETFITPVPLATRIQNVYIDACPLHHAQIRYDEGIPKNTIQVC